MSRVTKFAAQDAGPAARVAGFMAHLRANGMRLGAGETTVALNALSAMNAYSPDECRNALRPICTGCKEDVDQFDDLFDAYWMDMGRVRTRAVPKLQTKGNNDVHSSRDASGEAGSSAGNATTPDGGDGEAESDGEGKLIATEVRKPSRVRIYAIWCDQKKLPRRKKLHENWAKHCGIADRAAASPQAKAIGCIFAKSCAAVWQQGANPCNC